MSESEACQCEEHGIRWGGECGEECGEEESDFSIGKRGVCHESVRDREKKIKKGIF